MTADDVTAGDVPVEQWRVRLDAELTFGNGGGLRVWEFRLDIPGATITDAEAAELLVRHLGLLMVDKVAVSNLELLNEPHKGSRDTVEPGVPAREIVDLSHPITDGMTTYPGIPGPVIETHRSRADSRASYAPGTEFHFGRISMVGNTGTYLDTPFHRYADGTDLADFPLADTTDLAGVLIRLTGMAGRAIDRAALLPYDVAGKAVLLDTGWARHWGTEQYFSGHPYLTESAVEWLVEQGAVLVGIDSLNIDGTDDGNRPAHSGLLAANIAIVEHLCGLDRLPVNGFRFHAAPLPAVGMGTLPVRAYAVIQP